MEIRFGVSFRPDSPAEVIQWAKRAEELGYARVGIADSAALYREPWVIASLVAQNTRHVTVGTWVTNPITRHPVITASAAATVDELAPGRVVIGIATGDSSVYNLGYKAARVVELKEYVQTVRKLLEQGEAEYQNRRVRLPWAKRRIPIYVAAHGRRSLRLAAQVADGVIVGLGITPEVIRGCLQVIANAAGEIGRDPQDLDVWWVYGWQLSDSSEEARGEASRDLPGKAHLLSRNTLEGKFVPDELKAAIKTLGDSYDLTTHGQPDPHLREQYQRIIGDNVALDHLLNRFFVAGTPQECEAKLRAAMKAGATQFTCSLPGPNRLGRLNTWHDKVMRRFE